jgi:hypothetical protein
MIVLLNECRGLMVELFWELHMMALVLIWRGACLTHTGSKPLSLLKSVEIFLQRKSANRKGGTNHFLQARALLTDLDREIVASGFCKSCSLLPNTLQMLFHDWLSRPFRPDSC